jgi:hypothetical protein
MSCAINFDGDAQGVEERETMVECLEILMRVVMKRRMNKPKGEEKYLYTSSLACFSNMPHLAE